jgi:hypothetical protein
MNPLLDLRPRAGDIRETPVPKDALGACGLDEELLAPIGFKFGAIARG